jgi:hypothetical protein
MRLPASPGAVPWDEANNGVTPHRELVWDALRGLWRFSTLPRVRKCRRVTQTGVVSIERRGDRASYSGLQTCGSVHACPACSERILAERAEELIAAVQAHHAAGGRVAMVTLTMRHDRGQALEPLWEALSLAWRAARGGNRSARRAMERAGLQHWVRRVECTLGENGWHLHLHALLFLGGDVDQAEVDALGISMFNAWASALVRDGMEAPIRDSGGLDARLLDLSAARAEVGGYLAKGTYGESVRTAALELASSGAKRARRGNRTTMQLLSDVVRFGLVGDHAAWAEWEQASQGRRAMTWSVGARAALLAGAEERTDEEIAADTDREGVPVASFDADTWRQITTRPGLPARLLDLAESVPPAYVVAVLTGACRREGLPPPSPPGVP